ncbi:MAG: DUF1667 domain-containing protein [Actinobacteria bacterium]|nr:DUF1667 domain-containing protein [Actinomycetota bacterium]MBU1944590.1 DUF1667 domain-containing protein [Actinomycetota bacterium]MBU2689143.1 DUF1667 domain-containing protein [Actinomycetota bacterium]
MRSSHEFTCINCPLSCPLELVEEDGRVLEVKGAECRLGEKYAEAEFTDPRRVVTTTVTVRNGTLPLLPVRSTEAIPRRLVREAVESLASIAVEAPVKEGQVILADLLGTGVDVVSSRDLNTLSGHK